MATKPITADRILETALQLAEIKGWSALRLRDVTDALEITLEDLHLHFAQKDDIAEAWFDRADKAMLDAAYTLDLLQRPFKERIEQLILSWLTELAPHRRITAEMLQYKLLPLHVHLQLHGLTRISRTMQWLCEAAALESEDRATKRELEELGITCIYLLTFRRWLKDESEGFKQTRLLLKNLLHSADKMAHWLPKS